MLDIAAFSRRYAVRRMTDADAGALLDFCRQNTQFYEYCGARPTKARVLDDLHVAPPGKDASSKYYVGFYDGATLVAIMDLVDGYPEADCAYIGFFMMNKGLQGRGIGSDIIREVCRYLGETGFRSIRLAIAEDNPQATHFWRKNGFAVVQSVPMDGWTALVADKALS